MSLSLGIDTGGTYTDAVLIRDGETVIASAKALTTRRDLAIGIGDAVSTVVGKAGVASGDIGMAALSTTLATNALVEGQGGRVALVLIGFAEADVSRQGLSEALDGDPMILINGGHDHAGAQRAPLDEQALRHWLGACQDVSGFAVAAQFATRNAEHENTVAKIITEQTGLPVSCSHHLSARLNGPKRAVTAVLNARLIGMIDQLIARASDRLTELGIQAPLMVVRGDGALISADLARERPIETILSGPAASLVGAGWLTGQRDALVSDIGGTTTDVALLKDGRPSIEPRGAKVGAHRTMVEAVAMRTFGLGGDSQVQAVRAGLHSAVSLGPQRVVPVSLMATIAPRVVHDALDRQLSRSVIGEHDGQFVIAVPMLDSSGISERAAMLLSRLEDQVWPLDELLTNRRDGTALRELVGRGLAKRSGLTPSDASHMLGRQDTWDADAAEKAMTLFARQRSGAGVPIANAPDAMAQMIVDQLTAQTKSAILETVFSEEEAQFGDASDVLAQHPLVQAAFAEHAGLLHLKAQLGVPLIGLGASASTYYSAVGEALNCETILPEHAGVANAIGAVVGQIAVRKSGTITCPTEGVFRLHLGEAPEDHTSSREALERLEDWLTGEAKREAQGIGAVDVHLSVQRDVKTAKIEGRDIFVEATLQVEATGRPRVATG